MRFKNLLAGVAVLIGTTILSGCTAEPYVITANEEYVREFYKTFGTVNENQDWTAASRNTLTVTTDRPTRVRVIADVDGKTYLFADYDAVDGYKVLNYDVPKHATNAKAIINGQKYPIKPGDKIDLTNGSRALLNSGENTFAGVTVTVEENPHGRVLTLYPDVMTEAIDFLPENPDGVSKWADSNIGRVTDNFFAYAKEFYLFPEYWNTSGHSKNIIGVYWYVDDPNETDVDEVTVEFEGEKETYRIKHVPFFTNPEDFVTPYKPDITYKDGNLKFIDLPGWDAIWGKVLAKYPEKYYEENGEWYRKYPYNNNMKISELKLGSWSDTDHQFATDILSVDESLNDQITNFAYKASSCYGNYTTEVGGTYYESKAVHVVFSEKIGFGFYIKQGNNIMYSESRLNAPVDKIGDDGASETRQPSYVATFKNETDTEGNDKRYLCFEDWYNNNWDLNDMIFRVYGFDHIANNNPGLLTTGSIDDLDDPDDDENTEKPGEGGNEGGDNNNTEPEEEFDTYPWIIACEDLGATDDYDFNDVVFGVQHASGSRFVYVTALAAGGTLPARLYYTLDGNNKILIKGGDDDDSADPVDGNQFTMSSPDGSKTFDEWHKWFGSGRYSTEMINTGGSFTVGATVRITLSKEDAAKFSISNEKYPGVKTEASITNLGGFSLEIDGTDGKITSIKAPYRSDDPADNIPQLFSTTYKFCWPKERTSINTSHAGIEGQNAGTTPAGVSYNKGSFMHWVIAGDEADFHNTDPAVPRETIQHGWTGYSLTKK